MTSITPQICAHFCAPLQCCMSAGSSTIKIQRGWGRVTHSSGRECPVLSCRSYRNARCNYRSKSYSSFFTLSDDDPESDFASDLDWMCHPVVDRITGATSTRSPPSASASTEADEGGTSIYNNNNIAEDCGTPIYNNSCLEATSVSYRAAEKSRLPKRR